MEGRRAVAQIASRCPVADLMRLNDNDILARLGES